MFIRRLLVFSLVMMIGATSGCHSLRKKFTRKKRKQKEVAVYVDFKDYPEKPSREAYINYYLFVRGWLDDLVEALKKGVSYKRQRRAINEALMNLEQIIAFYGPKGKDAVYPIYEELNNLREDMVRSPNMSESKRNSVIRKIERLKRKFEKDFNYSDAEEKWMN
ncbi:MAG: hypothetical protein KAS05_02175 [Candidatus Omnitrophica bacterium]|nr:hypothetical protein [Candidatus Omnitrophota bacterium]